MAEARKEAEAEKKKKQIGGTDVGEKEGDIENLTNAQMYRLLCKGNSEILEAVKKVEKLLQDTKKELSGGLKKVIDENTTQLATHQMRIQHLEVNQERERVAEDKFEVLEVESKARNVKIKGEGLLSFHPSALPSAFRILFFHATTAARLVWAKHWKMTETPTISTWLDKLADLAKMARLTNMINKKPPEEYDEQ